MNARELARRGLERQLARARERLEATRRDDYESCQVFARVVSQRLNTVRRLKRLLAELAIEE